MLHRAAIHNLGCKVNSYEMDIMTQELRADGWEIVPFDETADVYIVNTCTVTSIADRKSRQMLHRAKHTNPGALVAAVGCYVETDRKKLEEDPLVDLCIGNADKMHIARILEEMLEGKSLPAQPVPDLKSPGRTRADIKIQDGCNMYCTYCIIPYARGSLNSRDPEEVVCEVSSLAAAGVKEVVLTGIHISSYGKDWHQRKGLDSLTRAGDYPERRQQRETVDSGRELLRLLTRLQMTAGLKRIRLGSLEPRIITEEFAQGIRRLTKVCPHFHLSLQSGCDATLRRMNRRYTTDEYREGVRLLRQYYDRPAITTDVIVGFPGETQEEFEETMRFVREIGFYQVHVFKYSPRKGTPAVKFPEPCTDAQKSDRSHALLELTHAQAADYRSSFLNETEVILLEDEVEVQGRRYYAGHTMRYLEALVPAMGHVSGEFVEGILMPGPEGTEYLNLTQRSGGCQ